MRNIYIDLSSDNPLQQPKVFGGYEGEHNETFLRVKLPKRMIETECTGYRFDFQISKDNKTSSPLIPTSELDNDILSFHLPEQLTVAGELFFNVVAITLDKDIVSTISKTSGVFLRINNSPRGKNVFLDPNGYKDELLKMIDERVSEISSIVGEETECGGEIFNDYESNTAGLMGFNIKTVSQVEKTVTFTLDSVEGLEAGDNVSALISPNTYDWFGTVSSVDAENVSITVNITDYGLTLSTGTGTLWVPAKPNIGTVKLGDYGFAANKGTKASAKAAAAFGEDNIAGSKRAFCGGGEENFAGYCGFVSGQKVKVRGVRSAGVGYNNDLANAATYSMIAGANNKLRSKATFMGGEKNTEGFKSPMGANFIWGRNITFEDEVYGENGVVGNGHILYSGAGRNLVGGYLNKIRASQSSIGGMENDVDGGYHTVGGAFNKLNGKYHAVFGWYNDVCTKGDYHELGEACLVAGYGNTIKGQGRWHFVSGSGNIVTGAGWCFVQGRDNKSGASSNLVVGECNEVSMYALTNPERYTQNNLVKGHSNFVNGANNFVNGSNNLVGEFLDEEKTVVSDYVGCLINGAWHKASRDYQTILGCANVVDPNAVFIVAIGTYDGNRKNAFVVKEDGSARILKESTEDDAVVRYSQLKAALNRITELETQLSNIVNVAEVGQ